MKIKGEIVADPIFESVTKWPSLLIGTLDIVDCGDIVDEYGYPSWGSTRFFLDGKIEKETTGFDFDGPVLSSSGIKFEEIDQGLLVKVYLEPIEGEYVPVAVDGKFIKEQCYRAVKFERI